MIDHIAKLRKEAQELTTKADLLEKLLEKFPDLERYENRWKTEHFSSAIVNGLATEYQSCHSCGCCSDSPLLIKPYVVHEGVRIYTNPYYFTIGEKEPFTYGDTIYPDWQDQFINAGCKIELIEAIGRIYRKDSDEDESSSLLP